jgi:hypothetical protein
MNVDRLVRVEGVGPAGFRQVIAEIFGRGEG